MGRMTQMNVRIATDLKTRGDAALQAAGLTPSSAVRAFWKYASDHGHEPHLIAEEAARLEGSSAEGGEGVRERLEAYARVRTVFADDMASLGVPRFRFEETSQAAPSVEELRDEALLERMDDRGLR